MIPMFVGIHPKSRQRVQCTEYSRQTDQNITTFHREILSNMLDSGAEIYLGKGKIVKYGLNIFIYSQM